MSFDLKREGDTDLVGSRRFAAPPELVFRAHLEPELIRQWMTGPEGWSMPVCEGDARPGGQMRYVWRQGDDPESEFGLTATFVAIEPPHRIVNTERWNGGDMPDTEVTTEFAPDGDGTRMTIRLRYASAELREAALQSGMVEGMEMSYDRIDNLAAA